MNDWKLDLSLEKKYKLVKEIVKFIYQSNLISMNLRGFYIQSKNLGKDGMLFVHEPEIQMSERILCIDFDKLVERISNP